MVREAVWVLAMTVAAAAAEERAMVDFGKAGAAAGADQTLINWRSSGRPGPHLSDANSARMEFCAPAGGWNVGDRHGLELDVRNAGSAPAKITLLARSGGEGANCAWAIVAPGTAATLKMPFVRLAGDHAKVKVFAMRGIPPHLDPKRTVDPSRLSAVTVQAAPIDGTVDV